ncbi:hypothetical protein V1477_011324 [Vespula maculifrons]|uniref:Uncharacterized protein n=1 Tax=Vespula maculifrons TaxID=7453 RepID=A0ABD2C4G7_VESMC
MTLALPMSVKEDYKKAEIENNEEYLRVDLNRRALLRKRKKRMRIRSGNSIVQQHSGRKKTTERARERELEVASGAS